MSLFTKIFGTHSDREIKNIMPIVEKVMSYEEEYSALSDEQLKNNTDVLRKRLEKGETFEFFWSAEVI